MIIAIDGPSGAGKSTVAKLLSKVLDFEYIDTGAMYRALAYKAYINNIEIDENKIDKMLEMTTIDYYDNKIYLDNQNVESLIRSEIISKGSSKISALKNVRIKMVALQRNIAKNKNVILDGRDIGTKVFPDADFKFFITASVETRAKRRYEQLKLSGTDVDFNDVLLSIKKRDESDSTRKISPLEMADDAILIDTSNMEINEVVKTIANLIGGKNVL
ncbi:MAG: (d)CMP kinase [Sedimentibacter sp.]|uniref:(d)CMP kinase n=1 Tax=Sedimentibacter sp. TaxID=1960295 RepID=UPI0029829A6F|nr:(d)CMP kinase [Sedimentibacter sp.]MDW5299866.1 (d)CMP kinase [Sedimentibacter sp.]